MTPQRTPNMVSTLRSLFARRLPNTWLRISPMSSARDHDFLAGLQPFEDLDLRSIAHAHLHGHSAAAGLGCGVDNVHEGMPSGVIRDSRLRQKKRAGQFL